VDFIDISTILRANWHRRAHRASAVLFENSVELGALWLYLGNVEDHTAFEGEGIGGVLAMVLLERPKQLSGPVSIYVDSQPGKLRSVPRRREPQRHPTRSVACAGAHPRGETPRHWSLGHIGIAGNERADVEARKQCRTKTHLPNEASLPASATRCLGVTLPRNSTSWPNSRTLCTASGTSKHYEHTMQCNVKLLEGSYLATVDCLPCSLAVLLI
jgi:hypothetical protein